MAVSLNSVTSFNPTGSYQHVTRTNIKVLILKVASFASLSGPAGLRQSTDGKRSRSYLLAASGDNIARGTTDNNSKNIEGSYSEDGSSANVSDVNSSATDDKVQTSDEVELAPQVSEVSNLNQEGSTEESSSTSRRAPLTARERLRAARVLSRYTESKPSKPELGSKFLEALRETDKGKKHPGLPKAPTNLSDDSNRGLPKQGWTINTPRGIDVFPIIFSFVFISSVMFATIYIVWQAGAIRLNEY